MIVFLAVLSVLIVVHEFGHFIVARRLGIRVEKFSLGFGPKLFGIKGKETEYIICAIPIGGYVKMAGDTREACKGEPYEFFSRSMKDRAKVIVMGPVFNYILSFLCFWFIFFIGFPVMTSRIGGLMDNMPAKAAGLKVNDSIISIDGKKTQYWEDVASIIQDKKEGENVDLVIMRGEKRLEMKITPQIKKTKNLLGEDISIGLIGITPSEEIVKIKYGLFGSIIQASERLFFITTLTLKALWRMVIGSLSFKESMTGPLGIFFATKSAFKVGLAALLHLVAVLGVSLAIFNILPMPLLDGGHLMFIAIERIKGKPVSVKIEESLNKISLGLLLTLVVFVFYNDLIRFNVIAKMIKFFALFKGR